MASPSVTAKAYPGVNYITWKVIPEAKSYEVYRSADGKSYTYTVVAVADNQASDVPSRAVYTPSTKGSASVKAVVPQAGLNVTEFTDSYSKNYFKKWADAESIAKNSTQVLVNAIQDGASVGSADGDFYATFPATAGFKYGVQFLKKSEYEATGKSTKATSFTSNYKENYTANYTNTTLSAGTYEAYLTIASVSNLYQSTLYDLGSIEVKDIGESSATGTPSATYLTSSSARISWTPAKLTATGDYTATTNYKVYRASVADNYTALTALTGSVVAGTADSTSTSTTSISKVYYIDDTSITDNTVIYKYYVVHTDGTYYASEAKEAELTAYASSVTDVSSLSFDVEKIVIGTDNLTNDIKVSMTKDHEEQTLALSWVNLGVDPVIANAEIAESAFAALTLENENTFEDSYIAYKKDAENGTYLIKLVVSEDGYKDAVLYETLTITDPIVSTDYLTVSAALDGTSKTAVKVTVVEQAFRANGDTSTDVIGNYTYALYKVTTTTDYVSTYSYNVTVKTEKVKDLSLSAGDGTTYTSKEYFQVSDDTITQSTAKTSVSVVYYVVKTHTASKAEEVATSSSLTSY